MEIIGSPATYKAAQHAAPTFVGYSSFLNLMPSFNHAQLQKLLAALCKNSFTHTLSRAQVD
jgi:hypothetical protein